MILKVVLKVLSTVLNGEPAGTRTQDPRLKRAMLYQLSYRLTEQRARILPPTLCLCLARYGKNPTDVILNICQALLDRLGMP